MPLRSLEVSEGESNLHFRFSLKKIKENNRGSFILGKIFLGRLVIASPKVEINLPRSNEKLNCIGEPY